TAEETRGALRGIQAVSTNASPSAASANRSGSGAVFTTETRKTRRALGARRASSTGATNKLLPFVVAVLCVPPCLPCFRGEYSTGAGLQHRHRIPIDHHPHGTSAPQPLGRIPGDPSERLPRSFEHDVPPPPILDLGERTRRRPQQRHREPVLGEQRRAPVR